MLRGSIGVARGKETLDDAGFRRSSAPLGEGCSELFRELGDSVNEKGFANEDRSSPHRRISNYNEEDQA